jgi:hypothetical protein
MVSKESASVTSKNETKVKKIAITRGEIRTFDRRTYNYMKKQSKLSEAEILEMSVAVYPAKINKLPASLCLFFNPEVAKEKGIVINDYEMLTENPDLILYEGYYIHGKGGEIIIKKWEGAGNSFVQESIKQGAITEAGIVIPRTSSEIWLGRIGNFMVMGGFVLVLVLVGVIAVVISLLVNSR